MSDISTLQLKPDYWYVLPHGYFQIDLRPSAESLQQVVRCIRDLPSEFRDHAEQVFRLYAIIVRSLQQQQVQGCAFGIHPADDGQPSLSVLTVSSLTTSAANTMAALTKLLNDPAATDSKKGIVPLALPVGTGFLVETERRTVAPGQPSEGQEGPREGTVWQGTVVIPDSRSSVITVQLVTPSVTLNNEYRSVLLGVARTVTFTDPSEPPVVKRAPGLFTAFGPASEERNPFG